MPSAADNSGATGKQHTPDSHLPSYVPSQTHSHRTAARPLLGSQARKSFATPAPAWVLQGSCLHAVAAPLSTSQVLKMLPTLNPQPYIGLAGAMPVRDRQAVVNQPGAQVKP